jgi:hypothetical protein
MMHVSISKFKPNGNQVLKLLLFAALASFITGGVMFAGALTANRDFDGSIRLEVCRKNAEGGWEVIDKDTKPLRFSASVLSAASGSTVGTDFTWRSRTAKGVDFTVRLTGAGSASFDFKTGQLDLSSMPFEVEVGGKRVRVPLTLTTESVTSPIGLINGKRAAINGRTAQLSVVGVGAVTSDITTRQDGDTNVSRGPADSKAAAKPEKAEQLALVVRVDGRLTAK